jgi:hypothetical protein
MRNGAERRLAQINYSWRARALTLCRPWRVAADEFHRQSVRRLAGQLMVKPASWRFVLLMTAIAAAACGVIEATRRPLSVLLQD